MVGPDEPRKAGPAGSGRYWLLPAAGALLAVGGLAGLFASRGTPFWFRCLIGGGSGWTTAVLLAALGLWAGFGSGGLACLLADRPRWALGLPVWLGLLGGLGLVWFRLASPGLPWARLWTEHKAHLAVLFCYGSLLLFMCSALIGGLCARTRTGGVTGGLFVLLVGAPWAVLAHLFLMGEAPGLVRAAPVAGHGFLAALVGLAGISAAAVARAVRRGRFLSASGALLLTAVLCVPGYLLLRLGLDPAGAGEGGDVAAYRALLAPEWAAPVAAGGLFLRWCLVQSGGVLLMALGQVAALRLLEGPAGGTERSDEAGERAVAAAAASRRARRAYAWVALIGAGLIVYGSLVPLAYRPMPFERGLAAFADIPYLALGVANRADLVANLLLFIPLTFTAMGALGLEGGRGGWLFAPLVLAGAVALAVGVEFAQVFFPPRTVSLNDIVAEGVGAAVGVGLWLGGGPPLTTWLRRAGRALAAPARLANDVLTAYVVGLVLYQLFPFDVVLAGDELVMQWEAGKVVLVPFADWGRIPAIVLAAKGLVMVPFGYWVVVRRPQARSPVLAATFLGGVFAGAIEVAQILVFSRYSSMTDVFPGSGGAMVGGFLATRLGPAARKPLPDGLAWRGAGWLLRLSAAVALVVAALRAKWAPFDFHWPAGGVWPALARHVHVPFYYQYWNSEFAAVGQLLGDVAMPLVLAMLLVSLFPRGLSGRRGGAAAVASAVAVVAELGQVAFPPHVPDVTTAVLATGGAIAGVYLYGPFVKAFVHPGGGADAEGGPEEPT